jgi:hypothetical protein
MMRSVPGRGNGALTIELPSSVTLSEATVDAVATGLYQPPTPSQNFTVFYMVPDCGPREKIKQPLGQNFDLPGMLFWQNSMRIKVHLRPTDPVAFLTYETCPNPIWRSDVSPDRGESHHEGHH